MPETLNYLEKKNILTTLKCFDIPKYVFMKTKANCSLCTYFEIEENALPKIFDPSSTQ